MTSFSAVNKFGVSTLDLVLSGEKDVTRRPSAVPLNSSRAIQPKMGEKQVGRYLVLSCMKHKDWYDKLVRDCLLNSLDEDLDHEAVRELGKGNTWQDLVDVERKIYGADWESKLYRVEFKVISGGKKL